MLWLLMSAPGKGPFLTPALGEGHLFVLAHGVRLVFPTLACGVGLMSPMLARGIELFFMLGHFLLLGIGLVSFVPCRFLSQSIVGGLA